ncbi:MAG: HAD family hydrolase [Clostridia bacterium]|nr:HAD family hydrolase [Clostridia bacterium]
MLNTILFDLDSTLLPMDTATFTNEYFKLLIKKIAPLGFNPDDLINAVWLGTKAMVNNDGKVTNEECFWPAFSDALHTNIRAYEQEFISFYENEFQEIRKFAFPSKELVHSVSILKEKGYELILATNPIFPEIATKSRIEWAGLTPDDFSLITYYENSYYAKPNLNYYRSILTAINKKPEECMMVGNDVIEDMCASRLGINCYLITDWILNKNQEDISAWEHGTILDFYEKVKEMP